MKTFFLILSLALITTISACQKKITLVGTWQIDKANTSKDSNANFTFKEDGTCSLEESAQIIFKGNYKLSGDGSEITFFNNKRSTRSSTGEITYEDSKDVYVVSVIFLTEATLKLGSFRREGESVETSKGKNKDYSSWKRI